MEGTMKRYVIFSGFNYEAIGGWNDYDSEWDSLDECLARVSALLKTPVDSQGLRDWAHIVDLRDGSIVAKELPVDEEERTRLLEWMTENGLISIQIEGGVIDKMMPRP
jgi:hypothetical protein